MAVRGPSPSSGSLSNLGVGVDSIFSDDTFSVSTSQQLSDASLGPLDVAAIYVKDGIHNRKSDHFQLDESFSRVYVVFHHPLYRIGYSIAVFCQISLALFEFPAPPGFPMLQYELSCVHCLSLHP